MKHGKKYNKAKELIEKGKKYPVLDACRLVKETTAVNYDATVRASFRLNVDPRHADQQIRGAMVLPNGTGRSQKVLVVTQGNNLDVAKEAGADFVGDKEILEEIKKGWFDFDIIVATPDMMGELGKLGKVLGPKGLMPNPKTGTVTVDTAKAIEETKKGKVNYRTDSFGNIHGIIGKASFDETKLAENLRVFVEAIMKVKPSTVKGAYVKNISISSTMGPGVKIDLNSIDK